MPLLTEEYIKERIIQAKLKSASFVTLISRKYANWGDYTIMFPGHSESIKERIVSFIDTTSMRVVLDEDHPTYFEVNLWWDH